MITAAGLFEPVRFVELDCRKRGVNLDALRAGAHRAGFCQPVQRRPDATARRTATDVDRGSVPAAVDAMRRESQDPVVFVDGDEEDFAMLHRPAIQVRRQPGAPLADDLGDIKMRTDGFDRVAMRPRDLVRIPGVAGLRRKSVSGMACRTHLHFVPS